MKALEKTATVLAWILIGFTAYLGFRPGGIFRTEIGRWLQSREVERIVVAKWDSIQVGSFIYGPLDVDSVIVEFIDYTCPYCRSFHNRLKDESTRSRVAPLAVRQLPNENVPRSRGASLAAVCAGLQGEFQAMHEYLLEDEGWLGNVAWTDVGEAADLKDLSTWTVCLKSGRGERLLEADLWWSERLRARGTPTFVSPATGVLSGVPSEDTFQEQFLR